MTSLLVDETSFIANGLVPRSNYTFTVSAVGVLDNNVNAAGPTVTVIYQTEISTGNLLKYRPKLIIMHGIITFFYCYYRRAIATG